MTAPSFSQRVPETDYKELDEGQKEFHAYLTDNFADSWGKKYDES